MKAMPLEAQASCLLSLNATLPGLSGSTESRVNPPLEAGEMPALPAPLRGQHCPLAGTAWWRALESILRMSTHKVPRFREKLSPFLLGKMESASRAAEVLALQYRYDPREEIMDPSAVSRHYDADIGLLRGVERIYRRTVVVEPTRVCAAHCRWCIRANYGPASLKDEEIEEIARFCGAPAQRDDLREVIVTGGDPLMIPRKLEILLEKLEQHAPNIETYRIATRLPLQNPALVDANMLRIFERFAGRVEVAIHVNHRLELFPEVVAAIRRLRFAGTAMYNHTVLLRGVNDTVEEQVGLAEK